ncbi:hypothetical protein T4D_1792 [Trichinella pseudospiralis]|uniref:Uncharacterized protein n=1 Tax=Trichinella pseudospiralis TaxID=6337 RepID=A0A0V1FBE8_TRIPS|nr:hypothetical protein T4D_1792 [Trichinella pseudospiralis]
MIYQIWNGECIKFSSICLNRFGYFSSLGVDITRFKINVNMIYLYYGQLVASFCLFSQNQQFMLDILNETSGNFQLIISPHALIPQHVDNKTCFNHVDHRELQLIFIYAKRLCKMS